MFQHQQTQHLRQLPRIIIATTAVLTALALGTGAGPATARQDPGTAIARIGHAGERFLVRIGTQYYRGDDNTGNGVPAPAWVPQR